MFGLSIFEILFLAGLALVVIGPKELPQVARTLGRFLNDLKRTTNGFTEELKQQARIDRIDLNEAPKKPEPQQQQQHESESSQVVPEQMELHAQEPVQESSSSEDKKS
ncbi:Sec-independent protein translocase subunit TatA/TatB [Bdellovibrio svalbardensis]|uniref:Twin-arginine translocase TatA/TatE family subunit n=1 Tax=Bdellovibrio svalbardensis TaxID=2972972 RepID=A0ABT6DDW6_9BACT|nr:twin-arginine translocase TatA/TatE family subunit [Bdellovibrio svalbardensis]MDG0814978.1 twin-arginine translocase TatA/TatE family subunit [Bdellovibrio svalbardensis]